MSQSRSPSPDQHTGGGGGLETRVFLENLPKDVRKDELVKAFSCFGDIAKVYLIYDPPGSGFVEFADHRDALVASDQIDGTDFLDVGLKIKTRLTRGGFNRGRGFNSSRGFNNSRGRGFSNNSYGDYSYNRGRGGRGSYDGGSRDNNYSRSGGDFRGSRGDSRGGYRGSRGSFGESRGSYRGSQGGYESRGRFQSSRGSGFRGSRGGSYDRSKRDFDEMRSGYEGSSGGFRGSSSSYSRSVDQYEGSSSYGSSYNDRGSDGFDSDVKGIGKSYSRSRGSRQNYSRDDDMDDYESRKYKHNYEDSDSNGYSGGKYAKYQKFGKAIGIDEEQDTKYSKYPSLNSSRRDMFHRSRSPVMESGRSSSDGRYQSQSSSSRYLETRSRSPIVRGARNTENPTRSYEHKQFAPSDKDEFRRPRSKISREFSDIGPEGPKQHRSRGKEFVSSTTYGNRRSPNSNKDRY